MVRFYSFFHVLAALGLVLATLCPANAQQPLVANAAAAAAEAGLSCAQRHLRAAAAAQLQPAASLEHRQKMARYDVKYYNLDLALENNSLNVSGTVWLRVQVGREDLETFAFELYQAPSGSAPGSASLTIDRVEFGSQPSLEVLRAGPEATAKLPTAAPAGSLLDVRITYHGTAPSGNSAAIGNALSTRSSVRVNGVTYPFNVTWSLSEPFSAHEWFPCKQVLTDKADSSDVSVTTTLPNKVGSNGVLSRTVPLPNNKVRYEWKSRNPIAYYLISVAVAPYIEHVSYANPAGGPRIPIIDYVYNQPTLSFYQTEINRTAAFLENFSSLYGLYPFYKEKYGHSMAPMGGGMEHQTMTTQDGFNFTLTAHELAHQWFGNNVTCATWADIWLNESFASYSEYLSLQAFPVTAPQTARAWMDDAHAWTRQSSGGSVRVPDADTTNVGRIFNYRLTYRKGAAVVHMLRYLLNDDTKFFRALRTYQTTYANKTARTVDMQRIFEAEAGRPLDYFFRQWYEGEGYPTFSVRWNQRGDQLLLSTTETVSMPTIMPFFDTDLDYRLTFSDGSTRMVRLRQSQPLTQTTLAVAGTVTAIELDPDQWIPNNVGTIEKDAQLATSAAAPVPALALLPNPVRDELRVLDLPVRRATAQVRDALGRVVQVQQVQGANTAISVGTLAPGLYLLRLTDEQGRNLGQGRFIKE